MKMDLKNAMAVCLISLFSATLVVLIARALDLQAASRLEPQLARIVEELEAIRKQGGFPTASADAASGELTDDGLVVYYFHGNMRCATCEAIESQSHEVVHTDFASQVESGEVVWKILNFERPPGADLAEKFEIDTSIVVLVRMKGGRIEEWNRLDKVWALWDDKPAFADFVRGEIDEMLKAGEPQPTPAPTDDENGPPIPEGDPSDIPVPTDIPVPQ
jgi:hypothetical protein